MIQPFRESANNRTLRRLMKRHKKNCREIAALLGYSHVTVRMWHAGHRPMADFAVKLLKLSLPR